MESAVNNTVLCGTLSSEITFSHENHCKKFYGFTIEVLRLSGTIDTLPVIAAEEILPIPRPEPGCSIMVTGQIRSHNIRTDGNRHLMIFLFANEIELSDSDFVNTVTIEGILCREPNLRRTPMGRDICDIMVAVPRAFRRADYLPCILWGTTALSASNCHTRDCIRINGRLQSRVYTKQGEDGPSMHTAYEISALNAEFITG